MVRTTTLQQHLVILTFRIVLLATALVLYLSGTSSLDYPQLLQGRTGLSALGQGFIWLVWVYLAVTILLRIVPNRHISIGSRKHFRCSFVPVPGRAFDKQDCADAKKALNKGALLSIVSWAVLTAAALFALHVAGILSPGIVLIIALVFGVLDRVFVTIYCPFQRLFMRNRCCTTCRIYNWDHFMMCLPLVLYPSFFSLSLAGLAILAAASWEAAFWRNPQRFSTRRNKALRCSQCTKKICDFKKLK